MIVPSAPLNARYISNSLLLRRDSQNNYNHHLRRLSNIKSSVSEIKLKNSQHLKPFHNLQRIKQSSKSSLLQKNTQHKNQLSSIISQKLRASKSTKSKFQVNSKCETTKILSKRSLEHKKRRQEILGENLRLIQNLKNMHKTSKQMKSQIKQQIKKYLSKRAHVRRNVLPSQEKRHKRELTYSTASQRTSQPLYRQERGSVKSLKGFHSVESAME